MPRSPSRLLMAPGFAATVWWWSFRTAANGTVPVAWAAAVIQRDMAGFRGGAPPPRRPRFDPNDRCYECGERWPLRVQLPPSPQRPRQVGLAISQPLTVSAPQPQPQPGPAHAVSQPQQGPLQEPRQVQVSLPFSRPRRSVPLPVRQRTCLAGFPAAPAPPPSVPSFPSPSPGPGVGPRRPAKTWTDTARDIRASLRCLPAAL
ncbi:hypothetical protein FJT64_001897 [Amphibalanus amphitrite]|uniref:Uncharacterized protein n=1 Tax=Amphibalanus amphitrite TaxID=1232801 RepID=A0A6A4X3M8_AMPAM|nr:hypothetical protein FJT64_001897 [Amphibalanus amphitrite]